MEVYAAAAGEAQAARAAVITTALWAEPEPYPS
jgi:hypothetical protein